MFNTFNMGVGMSIVVSPEDETLALEVLHDNGVDAYRIVVIETGEERIVLC
jgi:phosphoribosylformylglycinamidine cyclo-ligase